MSELEPRQKRFCQEYIIDLNATRAAIRAGYAPNSAQQQSSDLMSKPLVELEIQRLMDKRAAKLEIKAEDVLREVMRLAMVDIAGLFDDNGKLRPINEIPEDTRRAIAAVEVEELLHAGGSVQVGWSKKIKLWDKVKSLELLGKHLKLFKDQLEISGTIKIADRLREARQRAGLEFLNETPAN